MRDLVDGEEQVLIGGCSNHVGNSPELEREEGRVLEIPRASDLESDDAENDIFGQGLMTAELRDLGETYSSAMFGY